jgi:NADPH2:quinone reductase
VVATASRPQTKEWCHKLGAHFVIDHGKSLIDEFRATGFKHAEYVASLTATETHYTSLVELIAPQGKFGVIDGPKTLDAMLLKTKCASLHWEYMFARSAFETPDMSAQHMLLNEVADLIDAGILQSTANETFGSINAANLRKAHKLLESGKTKGKLVLEGF